MLDEAYQLATFYTNTGDKQALVDLLDNPRMKAQAGLNLNGLCFDLMYYFIMIPAAKTTKKIYSFDAGVSNLEWQENSWTGLFTYDSRVLVFVGFQIFFAVIALWAVLRLVVPVLVRVDSCTKTACLMLPYQLVMSNPLLSYKFND